MKTLRLGICGLGTVASGVVNVLNRNRDLITSRAGCSIEIVQVASRRKRDNCDLSGVDFTTDLNAVVNNPDVDVVLELIGGYDVAKDIVETALKAGKHVVTANKALIAEHGNELFSLARENGVIIGYEAGVAGGIPVIKALREGLTANAIQSIAGIINGTGNFILTEMKERGRAFEDVLAEAQALGYAEADPTFDVEGIDAAHKLTILASSAFGISLQFDKTFTEGISNLSTLDVKHAADLGYVIKHLGIARKRDEGVEVRVHPALVEDSELLARVDGVMNAVVINGDAVGKTLYYGAGAGSEATASAVIADVIDIAREYSKDVSGVVPSLGFNDELLNDLPVLPIDETVCPFYIRIMVDDTPGTLAKVATVMSDLGINIESVAQNEAEQVGDVIPLIIMTHAIQEAVMNEAILAIEALESTQGKVIKIRVAQF